MLRASAHGPIRILLPMISSLSEVRQVRQVMAAVLRRLKRRRVRIADPPPPLGVMIEIPGAALSADALAQTADFFAIGTNDLTMYHARHPTAARSTSPTSTTRSIRRCCG